MQRGDGGEVRPLSPCSSDGGAIDLFSYISQKYSVFGPSGNQSVSTLEKFFFVFFSYLHVSTPFLFVYPEP